MNSLSAKPAVTCIMPTADRRQFVPQAIRCFLAQDYPERELLIVDDGADSVANLVPVDPRIRYLRQEARQRLGAKRNFACEQARGEIIAHWDDDDWSAPWRLSYQVEQLLAANADVCGLERVLFYAPRELRSWEYVYPGGQRRWVYGASLCYTKAFWQAHRFPDIHVGEDARFVAANGDSRVHSLDNSHFLVAMVHEGNTSQKATSATTYRAKAVEEVERLLGDDLAFYRKLGGHAVPAEVIPDTGLSHPTGPRADAMKVAGLTARSNGSSKTVLEPLPSSTREAGDIARQAADTAAPTHTTLIAAGTGIGDILRMTPLVRVAHQLGHSVDLLLFADYPEVAELLSGAPEIRRLICVPRNYSVPGSRPMEGVAGERYDTVIFTPWTAPLRNRIRGRRILEVDRSRWLTQGYSDAVQDLARQLGWTEPMPESFAFASEREFHLPPGTVAFHPGCNPVSPWKKWHGFAELADRFPSVVILGASDDARTENTYFRTSFTWPEHVRDFTGQLSLPDTAALLRECAALVSNDSGIMHLGVSVGVTTLGIFGITSPERERLPSKRFLPISKGLECETACHTGPYGRTDCEYHLRCLKTLTSGEVAQKLLDRIPALAVATDQSSIQPQPAPIRTCLENIRVVVKITGGIGDVVLAGHLLRHLHTSVPECVIEVFYHTPDIARFVFHQARFVRGVHAVNGFEDALRRCDLGLRIHSMVRCEIRDIAKIRRVDARFAGRLEEAVGRFETFAGFFKQEPQFDGLWGRVCVRQGYDRRTSLGWLTGLAIERTAPMFLAPDPGEYAFFEKCFPNPVPGYVTVHDGFDNNVRLAPGGATKCWPLEHWIELVRRLKEAKPEVKIVQLGAQNSRSIPGVDIDLVRRTSLPQAAWVLKHAQAHIDGDSGLVHLARTLHTPSVVLFGPTDDQYFGYPQNTNLTASGCGNCWWSAPTWLSRCPRGLVKPECMTEILPERVFASVCKIVGDRRSNDAKVVASAVYGQPDFAELDATLSAIFQAGHMPRVPITQHGRGQEAGVYLHASKQWEYLFAWRHLLDRFGEKIAGLGIADLGGGRGAWPAFLASRGAEVEVFDLDYLWDHGGDPGVESQFFRWAQERGYKPHFGSLFNLPIETATVDAVTSISVVEHLRYKLYALKEALRVLKPGGLLLLTFDLSLEPERHQDALRQEIFSPRSLDRTLAELGISPVAMPSERVAESAAKIQQDGVLGIPVGMTVGGVAIARA